MPCTLWALCCSAVLRLPLCNMALPILCPRFSYRGCSTSNFPLWSCLGSKFCDTNIKTRQIKKTPNPWTQTIKKKKKGIIWLYFQDKPVSVELEQSLDWANLKRLQAGPQTGAANLSDSSEGGEGCLCHIANRIFARLFSYCSNLRVRVLCPSCRQLWARAPCKQAILCWGLSGWVQP